MQAVFQSCWQALFSVMLFIPLQKDSQEKQMEDLKAYMIQAFVNRCTNPTTWNTRREELCTK